MEASPSSDIHRLAVGVDTEFPIIRIALDDVGRRAFESLAAPDAPILSLDQEPIDVQRWHTATLEALFTLLRDPMWERRGAVLPVITVAHDLGDPACDILVDWLVQLFHELHRHQVRLEIVLVSRHLTGGIDAPDQTRIHSLIADLLGRVMGPDGVGRGSVTMLVIGDANGRNAYISPEDCVVKMTHVLRLIGDRAATAFFLDHVLAAPLLGPGEVANPWGWTHAFSAVELQRFRLPIDLQRRGRRAKRAHALRPALDATPPKTWQPAITSPALLSVEDAHDDKLVEPPVWSADMFGTPLDVATPLLEAIDDWELRAKQWNGRARATFDERIRAIETEGRFRAEQHREVLAEDLGRALRDPGASGFWRPVERLVIRLRSDITLAEERIGPETDHSLILAPKFLDPAKTATHAKTTMEAAIFARPNMVNAALSLAMTAGAVIALGLLAMRPDESTIFDSTVTAIFTTIWGAIERYAVLIRLPQQVWFAAGVALVCGIVFWLILLVSRRNLEQAWHSEYRLMQAWATRNRRTLITQRQRATDRANRRLLNEIKAAAIAVTTRVIHLRAGLDEFAADAPEGRPSRKDPDVILLRPEPLDRFSTMLDAKIVSTRRIDVDQIIDRFRNERALPFWLVGLPTDDDDDPTNDYDPLPALIADPADDLGPWTDEPTTQLEQMLIAFHQRVNQAKFRALRLAPNISGGARTEAVDVAIVPTDVEHRIGQTVSRSRVAIHVVSTENADEAVALRVDRRLTAEEIFGPRPTTGVAP